MWPFSRSSHHFSLGLFYHVPHVLVLHPSNPSLSFLSPFIPSSSFLPLPSSSPLLLSFPSSVPSTPMIAYSVLPHHLFNLFLRPSSSSTSFLPLWLFFFRPSHFPSKSNKQHRTSKVIYTCSSKIETRYIRAAVFPNSLLLLFSGVCVTHSSCSKWDSNILRITRIYAVAVTGRTRGVSRWAGTRARRWVEFMIYGVTWFMIPKWMLLPHLNWVMAGVKIWWLLGVWWMRFCAGWECEGCEMSGRCEGGGEGRGGGERVPREFVIKENN